MGDAPPQRRAARGARVPPRRPSRAWWRRRPGRAPRAPRGSRPGAAGAAVRKHFRGRSRRRARPSEPHARPRRVRPPARGPGRATRRASARVRRRMGPQSEKCSSSTLDAKRCVPAPAPAPGCSCRTASSARGAGPPGWRREPACQGGAQARPSASAVCVTRLPAKSGGHAQRAAPHSPRACAAAGPWPDPRGGAPRGRRAQRRRRADDAHGPPRARPGFSRPPSPARRRTSWSHFRHSRALSARQYMRAPATWHTSHIAGEAHPWLMRGRDAPRQRGAHSGAAQASTLLLVAQNCSTRSGGARE